MPETLLRTKLFVPPLRPNLISRPQLIERLNQGIQLGHKLILISAPAGFGKTTLLSEWLSKLLQARVLDSRVANGIAWLSLDEGDTDLRRFLTYFVQALSRVDGAETTIGKGALAMLQSPQPPPAEPVLTALLNDLTSLSGKIVPVLDDYHLVDSSPVDDALTFFLDHLPPQVNLVIATRIDPNLPFALLRARGKRGTPPPKKLARPARARTLRILPPT